MSLWRIARRSWWNRFFTEETRFTRPSVAIDMDGDVIMSTSALWPRDNCAAQKRPASGSTPGPVPASWTLFLIPCHFPSSSSTSPSLLTCSASDPLASSCEQDHELCTGSNRSEEEEGEEGKVQQRHNELYSPFRRRPGRNPSTAVAGHRQRILSASRTDATKSV